jgi:hypothetical protein
VDGSYAKLDRQYARRVAGSMVESARTSKPPFTNAPEWQDNRAFRDRAMIFGQDRIEQKSDFMKVRLDVLMAYRGSKR